MCTAPVVRGHQRNDKSNYQRKQESHFKTPQALSINGANFTINRCTMQASLPEQTDAPWRIVPEGVELDVRLTPRGGASRIEGLTVAGPRPCLKVRVAAPPVEGAANAELVAFLARSLGLPRSAVTLVAGERARVKRLRLRGDGLPGRLAALVPPLPGGPGQGLKSG